jgi:hypothetical protein
MNLVVDFVSLLCVSALSSYVVIDLGKRVLVGVGKLKDSLFSKEAPCCRDDGISNIRSTNRIETP